MRKGYVGGFADKSCFGRYAEPNSHYAEPNDHSAIRVLQDRLNDVEFHMRDKVVPNLTDIDANPRERPHTDVSTSYQLQELHSRIEKEEKARVLLDHRMVKSIDAALLPIQSAIQDEANVRQTHITNIQSSIRVLRSDVENDLPNRLKQMDGLKRQVAQTKDEIDKEVEERTVAIGELTSSLQDLQKTVERLKQERHGSEEMIHKLVSDEERARTSQLSLLHDFCNGMQHDIGAELKIVRQTIDARVRQRRQGDDELIRRMDEFTLSIEQEHKNCEALEASVKKELAEVKQLQKNERADMSNFIQIGLQALDNQMSNRLADVEVNITKGFGQSKSVCEGVEKRLSVLFDEVMHLKDRTPLGFDEEALKASVEKALQAIEKEARDRSTSEEALRQQVEHLSELVEPRPDRFSVMKQEEQSKPDGPDFDLMSEIRSISMNHLQGTMRIWGGKSDNDKPAHPSMAPLPMEGSLPLQLSVTQS